MEDIKSFKRRYSFKLDFEVELSQATLQKQLQEEGRERNQRKIESEKELLATLLATQAIHLDTWARRYILERISEMELDLGFIEKQLALPNRPSEEDILAQAAEQLPLGPYLYFAEARQKGQLEDATKDILLGWRIDLVGAALEETDKPPGGG